MPLKKEKIPARMATDCGPLMVSFEGDITRKPVMDGDAMIPTVIVRRFIGVWPGQRCERATSKAGLSDQ